MNKSRVTMRDVADVSGVSVATVSHHLNGTRSVADSTATRVQQAIRSLGYERNMVARGLRTNRTNTLGLIISDVQNPFFTSVIVGVENYARAHGFNVFLCNADEDCERTISHVGALAGRRVDGLIIAAQIAERDADALEKAATHVRHIVYLDREISGKGSDTVRVNNVQGITLAVNHLRDLGHTRLGLISGPLDSVSGRERHEAFMSATSEAGLPLSNSSVRFGDYRLAGGEKAALELLGGSQRPTGLVVANNLMTLGALRAIRTLGIAIPGEISLIGFDDMEWAPFLDPPLTTVAQPTYELGEEAARILISRVEGRLEDEALAVRLAPELIVRDSTSEAPL